jgi:hypothetical protein
MKNIPMSIGQNVLLTLNPEDNADNAGIPGIGVPAWSVAPAGITLTPASDGMSSKVDTLGSTPGTYVITTNGPATNGANIDGQIQVTVAENPATHYDYTIGPVQND